METAAILVHSLNRFSLCTKMAAVAVAKLLLCCDIICKRSIEGASNLDTFVSDLDICLASCSMMSDSCSDVFACSFFIKLSGTTGRKIEFLC